MNLLFLFVCALICLEGKTYPLQFGIPQEKIVDHIPQKSQDFGTVIPGQLWTYIFSEEADYYADYQKSYFAYTRKKGGWDCIRHYEILACGCIPYFVDLADCDPMTMIFLPKDLILEAMDLPGVNPWGIDWDLFDEERYREILERLLDHTKKYLTTRALAQYFLKTAGYEKGGKILFFSDSIEPDYMRCLLLEGLKEIKGADVVDIPKISHIYKSYSQDVKHLYGKGMSYTKIVDDLEVDRENIEERICLREFDLVVYGSVHRGLRCFDLVSKYYSEDEIFYICGEDAHICQYTHLPHLFLREHEAYR